MGKRVKKQLPGKARRDDRGQEDDGDGSAENYFDWNADFAYLCRDDNSRRHIPHQG